MIPISLKVRWPLLALAWFAILLALLHIFGEPGSIQPEGHLQIAPRNNNLLHPTPNPTPIPLTHCEQAILRAVGESDWGNLAYSEQDGQGSWSLVGISGRLQTWRWDPYHDGPRFDLAQVYYRHAEMRYPLWAAVGVALPPEPAEQGGLPRYVSFTEGVQSHADALRLFEQPGEYLVSLKVQGTYVSARGVDWERCEAAGLDYCRLGRFFESLSPPMMDIPFPGESNLLIHTGSASPHPSYGFLLWPIRVAERLDLCPLPTGVEHLPEWQKESDHAE